MKMPSSRKQESWPRKIKAGRITVTVYRRMRPSGVPGFQVANYSGGSRKLESFETEADALERGETLARQLANGHALSGTLTSQQAAEYLNAVEILRPHGLALLPTVQSAVEAFKALGSLPDFQRAVAEYARRHPSNLPSIPVKQAVEECIAEKAENGASDRYREDLKYRLGAFADSFRCNVASITGEAIDEWLRAQKLSPQSRMNHRRVLSVFAAFCIRRGYLPKSWDELDKLPVVKVRHSGETPIYSPEEIAKLLAHADPDFLPVLVLSAFCGLRSAEIERLNWADVNLAGGHVVVGARQSKTGSRRIVPLSDNARAWLRPYSKAQGKVWTGGHAALYNAQRETAGKAGMKWKHNAGRHSFCSYRLALVQNAAQVALEAGNSATMIFRHYHELVTRKQAEGFFAVAPDAPANVVGLAATA